MVMALMNYVEDICISILPQINIEFDKECTRLLSDIHKYDVLRSDKSISSHGLEPRTPFLDRSFVNYYMSIPMHIRNRNVTGNIEKYLLRQAFSKENYGLELLPHSILFRTKKHSVMESPKKIDPYLK